MKKLLVIVFVAIIAAGVASPVYAQGDTGYPIDGYPVDQPPSLCSDFYWDGINPDDCVAYYETEYPDVASGCPEGLEGNDCVIYYEDTIFNQGVTRSAVIYDNVIEDTFANLSVDNTTDLAAGGEGPNATLVISLSFVGLLVVMAYLTYRDYWKHR